MWVYIFYLGDTKEKNTDILQVDNTVGERIKKEVSEGKPIIVINPGESSYEDKKGKLNLITYYQYIVLSNVCKIIVNDLN